MAARASRVENQDAIDAAIVGMLGDPKEVFNNISFFMLPNARIKLTICYFSLSKNLY
jgi:hypothetical protein